MEVKPLLYWDNGYWLPEKSAVIKKRSASLSVNLLEEFHQGQHTEAVVQRGPRWHLTWKLNLATCKSLPQSTGFGGSKRSWKTAEAWHWERPGEATLKVQVSNSGDTIVWDMPGPWDDHQEQRQV